MITTRKRGQIEIEMVPVRSEVVYGEQLLDEVVKEPTLDRYLDRSPKVGQPINYPEMVGVLQRKRAIFITAEQKRKEPKIEGETDEVETSNG